MITRIQAQKYRCFDWLDIKLGSYNVLAGANGSGKSTLMDIPLLFSDMLFAKGVAQAFLGQSSSTKSIRTQRLRDVTYCQSGNYFGFALEATLPQDIVERLVNNSSRRISSNERRWPRILRYEIAFGIFNEVELQVQHEALFLIPGGMTDKIDSIQGRFSSANSWRQVIEREIVYPATTNIKAERGRETFSLRLPPDILALSSLPPDATLFPATTWFTDMLKLGTMLYEPDVSKMQEDAQLVSYDTIRFDASNLPWMVLNLQKERPVMYEAWVAHVQTALPHIRAIEAKEREDRFHAYLNVTYDGDFTIPSSGLSAGTLRILALTILPYLTNPPKIVCLEEPENGIHPRGIEAVLQSLTSLYDSQVLLSTHSPIVLAHTELSSIILMQSEKNGEKRALAGEQHPHLRDWHGEIDLGSLFAAGVLE